MHREQLHELRKRINNVLEEYQENKEQIRLREQAYELVIQYADKTADLDKITLQSLGVVEEISSPEIHVDQQTVIDTINDLHKAMHEEVI